MLCVVILPFEPLTLSFGLGFLVPLLWLGVIISVVAQLLFYRLIRTGNLVNSVTFPISKSSGAFLFNELGFHLNSDNGGLPGTYSVAAFYHTGTRANVGYRPDVVKDGDYGIFFMADQ
ncbi:MAG TPA: carbohydrate porin, partial [Chthoniobacterales bacterium]|nr:carbohydrate porin [Chthoniobacterales bacterium]